MEKRLFQILDEMDQLDVQKNTQTVGISTAVVEMKTVKQGGIITVGVDTSTIQRVITQYKKYRVILMVIDYEKFEELDQLDEDK